MRIASGKSRRQFHRFEQFFYSVTALRGGDFWPVDQQRLRDALLDGEIRIKGRRGVLENKAHALAQLPHAFSFHSAHLLAEYFQRSAGGLF